MKIDLKKTSSITIGEYHLLLSDIVDCKREIASLNWQLEIKQRTIQILKASKKEQVDLSDKELKQLAVLCHPDKHNGSKVANDMFVKVNGMRG